MLKAGSRALIGLALLGVVTPVVAQNRPPTDSNGDPIGVLFPLDPGHPWAQFSGTVFRRVYNRVPHPETATMRSPEVLKKFMGNPDLVNPMLAAPTGVDRNGRPVPGGGIPQLEIGPGKCMLIGVHLGSLGSEGYDVEITKVERTTQGPKIRITWRLVPKGEPAPGGVPSTVSVPGAPGTGNAPKYQTSAPAHVIKIPYLDDPQAEFQFIEETLSMRFPGLEAIALQVEGGEFEDLNVRVNQLGWVNVDGNSEPVGKALVSEMIALGQAIKQSNPVGLIREQGVNPTLQPESGALRSNVSYKLFTWHGEGAPQETGGSWDAARPRLQPLRDALEAIVLRLKGDIRPEDLARLMDRLPFSQLELQVLPVRVTMPGNASGGGDGEGASNSVEVLPGLRIRVSRLGVVQCGKGKGRLTEPEWELLARVAEKTDPLSLPELLAPPADIDPSTQVMPSTMHRKFKLEVLSKDGQLHHVGGSLFGGEPGDRARVQGLKHALELIASRIERRAAEIAGELRIEGQDVRIHWPLVGFTYKLDPVEGDPQTDAHRLKLMEWNGKWVEVKAIARANTAETGDAVVSRILYPQRAEVSGIFTGSGIQWQEPGLRANAFQIAVAGARSGRLLAGENGRWVKVDAYLFYDEQLRPSEAWVEAIQVVLSRRAKFRLRRRDNVQDEAIVQLFATASKSSQPVGTIHVPATGAKYYWVTDRANGFSYIPSLRGWAEEDNRELFHIGEDPKDVEGKGRIDRYDIIDAVLKGLTGNSGTDGN